MPAVLPTPISIDMGSESTIYARTSSSTPSSTTSPSASTLPASTPPSTDTATHTNDGRPRRRCVLACTNCRQRKVRCTGSLPCYDCESRGLASECRPAPRDTTERKKSRMSARLKRRAYLVGTQAMPLSSLGSFPGAGQGSGLKGDATNLAFVSYIGRIIREAGGMADSEELLVPQAGGGGESSLKGHHSQLQTSAGPPCKPTLEEARSLLGFYELATAPLVCPVDAQALKDGLPGWLSNDQDCISSAVYYLALAIGCQTCPGNTNRDGTSREFFRYGRNLSMSCLEDTSMPFAQAHCLSAVYLLADSSPRLAFMHLVFAVKAARAMGLDDMCDAPPARASLWRAIQVLDLFISTAHGFNSLTADPEAEGPKADDESRALDDLYAIFKDEVSNDAISQRAMPKPTTTGGKDPFSTMMRQAHGTVAYYWAVIALSRSSLLQLLSSKTEKTRRSSSSFMDDIVGHSCVTCAFRAVDAAKVFSWDGCAPKRMPILSHAMFTSSLVLCLAILRKMGPSVALKGALGSAMGILRRSAKYETRAELYLAVLKRILGLCDIQVEQSKMEDAKTNECRGAAAQAAAPTTPDALSTATPGLDQAVLFPETSVYMGQSTNQAFPTSDPACAAASTTAWGNSGMLCLDDCGWQQQPVVVDQGFSSVMRQTPELMHSDSPADTEFSPMPSHMPAAEGIAWLDMGATCFDAGSGGLQVLDAMGGQGFMSQDAMYPGQQKFHCFADFGQGTDGYAYGYSS